MREQVAVVSGGTRGIGLALSRRLVKLGHRVVALYRGDDTGAAAAATELGPMLRVLRADVGDPAAVAEVGEQVLASYGPPQVLVNNAGRNVDRPFLQMDVDDWRQVIDTNLNGAFYLTKAFAPAMTEGSIVNIGATTGIRPRLNGANYCASKAGLLQLTKCLALELAPRIRVNCLIPGMTRTPELTTRFHLDDPAALAKVLGEIPLARLGTADDVADALEFLIGPGGAYVTGQKLIVDGGQYMW
ncbi:SDR family NAD(P)-dependent oxidoreductase [Actinocrispum wychmicini]|uniref:Acetoacetyl-CoA reductase/3-oxoacyl-[acyl-carrier protein] reductase n=1 Tax=Actinocrispum wychmicini TaxID=1213861 RepID=A0A4R2JKX5_9PSEU|nr:SDR family oxidoreductase [Actinocrispum wychmicini]TCO60693.1 acetoacetyl-CoA reductase/3-oxoacyl-[acyl-carrier protein] reductase [Actinocrispum wychmicini]